MSPQHQEEQLLNPDAYTWRPLNILAVYRVVIVACIAALFLGTRGTAFMQTAEPGLFQLILASYFGLSLVAYALIRARAPGFLLQVYLQYALDIVAITHLILASGTLGNGLSALMVVAIAGASILVTVRTATLFAALASLILLVSQALAHLNGNAPRIDYSQVGFLGISIFATALLSSLLAARARQNQALADRRGHDLASLEALNGHIVQAMQSGVVALDQHDRVRLLNAAAWTLLGQPLQTQGAALSTISPQLADALSGWRDGVWSPETSVRTQSSELIVRFRALGTTHSEGVLIFIDDAATLRAQVQQAKLASIGKLTANIAHEIRNPLGAISHAAQLLEESPELPPGDRRLAEIVRKQGARLNRVVENVLQLSRRQQPATAEIDLQQWLPSFVRDFREQYPQHETYSLELSVPAPLVVRFDPDHLHQILTNLCRNAIQHGRDSGVLHIQLAATARADGRAVLEVADNGKGIEADVARKLFEPFYTTSSSGTGLGLYLCEELCASNRAHLSIAPSSLGARFQLNLVSVEEVVPA